MATVVVSKLTRKYQTTIPAPVREALHLSAGDLLVFEVGESGTVTIRKWAPIDLEFARALECALSEWATDADDEAFREL